MTGTEKILRHIADQAEAQAKALLAETDEKIAALRGETDAETAKIIQAAQKEAEKYLAEQKERTSSALDMRRRQALLGARGELVQEALAAAQDKLLDLNDTDYFAFLYRLFEKQEELHDGEILLSERDLSRLPADFEKTIAAAAEKKGAKITLSKEPQAILGGFVLNYGGSLENCSVEAIFASEADALKDKVRAVLFAEDVTV